MNDTITAISTALGVGAISIIRVSGKDAIKIGYTDQHPEKRIAQWKEVYGKNESI